jgi:hypothetical protein
MTEQTRYPVLQVPVDELSAWYEFGGHTLKQPKCRLRDHQMGIGSTGCGAVSRRRRRFIGGGGVMKSPLQIKLASKFFSDQKDHIASARIESRGVFRDDDFPRIAVGLNRDRNVGWKIADIFHLDLDRCF